MLETKSFSEFDVTFISEITFLLSRETFSIDDRIFEEEDEGE
jgi:hypothetical protein